jgi:hypothetical protein
MKKTISLLIIINTLFVASVFAKDNQGILISDEKSDPIVATVMTTGLGAIPDTDSIAREQKKEMGRRAAIVDGYRNLLAALKGAEKYLAKDGLEVYSVEGYLKDIEITETRYLDNGMVEVDMMVSIPVNDKGLVNDTGILGKLTGKAPAELQDVKVVETDENHQVINGSDIVPQETQQNQ